MGNIGSILNMGRAAGGHLIPSDSADEIAVASRLILPGVGAFDRAVLSLRKKGISDALNHAVLERKVPILGICLGMQLFTRCSEEGDLPGFAWVDAVTTRFKVDAKDA